VVDLEGELISSLKALDNEMMKNIRISNKVEEYNNMIEYLCIQIQKTMKIVDSLKL